MNKEIKESKPLPKKQRNKDNFIPFGEYVEDLPFTKDPEFYYYRFNDIPGRIARAKQSGYEIVNCKGKNISNSHLQDSQKDGAIATTDVGGGITGIYMKVPIRVHNEHLKWKKNQNNDTMAAIDKPDEYKRSLVNSSVDSNGISFYNKVDDRIKIDHSN